MSDIQKEELLPVLAARERIEAAIAASGSLILSAPPGTGKSTQVPRFLIDPKLNQPGQVLVLQPRRIAARALAARMADEIGEPLGKTVGYQVRFENVSGPETRLLFQTYGTFRQRILRDPDLSGVQAVVLDEFHERAWEADLALLWCRELRRQRRPDLRLVVMSATLDADGLATYLPDAAQVSVEGRAFPVEIRHQPARQNEFLPQQVLRALKSLGHAGWSGSALVFLPGAGEIRQAMDQLGAYCRKAGFRLCELHGSLPLNAQQDAIRAPLRGPSILLTTNVAETSLTVPGVTAVIDAGLHRVASYDPERDLNTLYLQSVSMANAIQRAGRAGRVAPGVCVRLWDSDREKHMAKNLEPEVKRVELSEAALALHSLGQTVGAALNPAPTVWPTPPDPSLWKRAEEKLERVAALHHGKITSLGKSLLHWPAPPTLARVLHDAAQSADSALQKQAAAMAACLSAGKSSGAGKGISDLFILAENLVEDEKKSDRELVGAYRQFLGNMKIPPPPRGHHAVPPDGGNTGSFLRQKATQLFLPVYIDRLAARSEGGQSFVVADGRRGVATASSETKLLLALEIHESGGKDRMRQTTLPLFLPVEPAWVESAFPGECVWEAAEEFDAKKGKVIHEDRLSFRGLVLDRREKTAAKNSDAGDLLVEQILRGEIQLPLDEEAQQWVYRIQLAHRIAPESGIPALDEDDWKLIYHDICEGKKSVKQLEDVSISAALRDYLGYAMTSFLEREVPTKVKLPGKRDGKITYFEKSPPELSGRLGDFIGMEGRFKILMKRVDVTFDILAPNYRTVQKTSDLTSFWQNSYPEVKKELERKYPRHPWP